MKKLKKILLLLLLFIIVVAYFNSFDLWGNKEETVVNNPVSLIINEKPRLEDDFYDNVNFEYLRKDNLNGEMINYFIDRTEKIENEKERIIKEYLNGNGIISRKMNVFNDAYMNNTKEQATYEINKYIMQINESQDINEFVNKVIDINYELSTDILFAPDVIYNLKGESKKYFGFNLLTYDWDNTLGYYSIKGMEDKVRMYKKYDIQLLKEYGYSTEEACRIADDVQEMYRNISMFSEIDQNKLFERGYKIYSEEKLQNELNNINLTDVIKYYSQFYEKDDGILVVDINQLKQIDKYLKEENLETLKKYAMIKILTTYAPFMGNEYYEIYYNYMNESNNYIKDEEHTKEEIGYKQLYKFFKDTITEQFAKENFTIEQKIFYTNLIKDEMDILKERIEEKDWISDETKQKAILKIDNIDCTVGVPDEFVKVENNYNLDADKSYVLNIIDMKQKIKEEEMRQYKKGNISYNLDEFDQLTVNAFYMSANNSINLLLGYIYSSTDTFGLENLNESYYTILGSIGATIGHELTHSLDTTGSKYDENGNYINWWTEEDTFNFNSMTSKVVKYYEKYEQFGDTTIGENIADLGGIAIVVQLAENNNANTNDFKELFQAYAQDFASQETSIFREWLLKNDVHSPNKNRVNAVLSTLDKFYKVYNVKQTDRMYVSNEDRVFVW